MGLALITDRIAGVDIVETDCLLDLPDGPRFFLFFSFDTFFPSRLNIRLEVMRSAQVNGAGWIGAWNRQELQIFFGKGQDTYLSESRSANSDESFGATDVAGSRRRGGMKQAGGGRC